MSYVLYEELLDINSHYGDDYVMIDNDINLIKNTNFDETGFTIIDIDNYNNLLQNFVTSEIRKLTHKNIKLENYHNEINDNEHKLIINSMPYKKNQNKQINDFCNYLETIISNILQENIKIFNDDLWVRIARPSNLTVNNYDYNPCHRDVYLPFYRNTVNIYLPIVGSNELSSLKIEPGSHKWSENKTIVTKGGAYFKSNDKKYSVDAIVASREPIKMIRPNPSENQLMLFSPYLIHGCSDNGNTHITRMSLEIRFIRDDINSISQEIDFNKFLNSRIWR